jgi:hypothetical protein
MSEDRQVRDHRRGGWFWVTNELILRDGAKIGPYGIAVYNALAVHANAEGVCFPSVKTIAEIVGCSVNKARDSLKMLESMGWIRIEERKENQEYQSNLYILLPTPTHQMDNPTPHSGEGVLHTVESNKTHSEQDSSKDSLPSPAKDEKPSHKKRDLLFEMVCSEVLDFEYKPGCKMPKSLQGLANGITADLRTIECTPQELRGCMQAWDKEHGKDFSRPKARGKVTQAVMAYREKRKPTPTPKPPVPKIGLDITQEQGQRLADELERLKAEMEAKRDAA